MKRIYYFIQSDTDGTDAGPYIVRVGRSDPEQRAHASIKSRANADHVKNLSPQFLRRAKFKLIQTQKQLL